MTKDEDFKLLKIQTCVLRVNIHCDGCKQEVKKLLQRIEGVYQVNIDSEQQKVTVSGSVDSATLVKKLVRAGKHAELWSLKTNQNQKQKSTCFKDDKNKGKKPSALKGIESLKNKQKFPFIPEEEFDCLDDDDEDYDEDAEMQLIRDKINQFALLKQQAEANSKKGNSSMAAGHKMNNNVSAANVNNKAGKKGNPGQNMVMKPTPGGGIDQKTLAALKMNNEQQLAGANTKADGKRANDISTMMNLSGFHGNGANNIAAVLGGNSNGIGGNGGFQVQPNNLFQAAPGGYTSHGLAAGHNPSSMMMNLQNRHAFQQPQMMYNRSPFVPPSTGYYYNYGYNFPDPGYAGGADHSATHMFSDDNTSSCGIM